MALRGLGPESEAESVRFHGRRVTKVGPEVKAAAGGLGTAEQGVREAHSGCGVSGGGGIIVRSPVGTGQQAAAVLASASYQQESYGPSNEACSVTSA